MGFGFVEFEGYGLHGLQLEESNARSEIWNLQTLSSPGSRASTVQSSASEPVFGSVRQTLSPPEPLKRLARKYCTRLDLDLIYCCWSGKELQDVHL